MPARLLEKKILEAELNRVYLELCKKFFLYRSSYTASAVAEQRIYSPPPELIELERLDFDERKLGQISIDDVVLFGDNVTIETPTWTEDV